MGNRLGRGRCVNLDLPEAGIDFSSSSSVVSSNTDRLRPPFLSRVRSFDLHHTSIYGKVSAQGLQDGGLHSHRVVGMAHGNASAQLPTPALIAQSEL